MLCFPHVHGQGLQGVENVYTRHEPQLVEVLQVLVTVPKSPSLLTCNHWNLVLAMQSLFRNSLDLDAYPPVGPLAPPFPVAGPHFPCGRCSRSSHARAHAHVFTSVRVRLPASVAAAGAGNFKAIARNLFPLGGGGPAAAVGELSSFQCVFLPPSHHPLA